jgi:hypothetical protein
MRLASSRTDGLPPPAAGDEVLDGATSPTADPSTAEDPAPNAIRSAASTVNAIPPSAASDSRRKLTPQEKARLKRKAQVVVALSSSAILLVAYLLLLILS